MSLSPPPGPLDPKLETTWRERRCTTFFGDPAAPVLYAADRPEDAVRLATRDYQARMRRDALEAIRREARTNMGGRTMTPDEIMALVKAETSTDPA